MVPVSSRSSSSSSTISGTSYIVVVFDVIWLPSCQVLNWLNWIQSCCLSMKNLTLNVWFGQRATGTELLLYSRKNSNVCHVSFFFLHVFACDSSKVRWSSERQTKTHIAVYTLFNRETAAHRVTGGKALEPRVVHLSKPLTHNCIDQSKIHICKCTSVVDIYHWLFVLIYPALFGLIRIFFMEANNSLFFLYVYIF